MIHFSQWRDLRQKSLVSNLQSKHATVGAVLQSHWNKFLLLCSKEWEIENKQQAVMNLWHGEGWGPQHGRRGLRTTCMVAASSAAPATLRHIKPELSCRSQAPGGNPGAASHRKNDWVGTEMTGLFNFKAVMCYRPVCLGACANLMVTCVTVYIKARIIAVKTCVISDHSHCMTFESYKNWRPFCIALGRSRTRVKEKVCCYPWNMVR